VHAQPQRTWIASTCNKLTGLVGSVIASIVWHSTVLNDWLYTFGQIRV